MNADEKHKKKMFNVAEAIKSSEIKIFPHPNRDRVKHNDFYNDGEHDVFQFLLKNFDLKVVFDVGCRTDFFYPESGPDISYHMFEPSPIHHKVLMEEMSRYDRSMTINNFGLGNKKERSDYYPWSGSLFDRKTCPKADFQVDVITLDEYCSNNSVSQIDFLSIDADGYDLKVIKGGMSVLKDTDTFVQFEYGPMAKDGNVTIQEFYDLFPNRWFYYISETGLYYMEEPREDFKYANYLISYIKLHDNPDLVGVKR